MTATDTSLDLLVLGELDFPVPCGHSRHSEDPLRHDGKATHVAVSFHDCPKRPGSAPPYFYPCCVSWAAFVTMASAADEQLFCSLCGQLGRWREFVKIVGPL
jgi:hypothetical protein